MVNDFPLSFPTPCHLAFFQAEVMVQGGFNSGGTHQRLPNSYACAKIAKMSLFPVVQNHLQHHHFTFKEGIRSVRNTTSMCTILQTPFSKLGNTLKNIFLFKTVKCKLQYLNIINRYKTLSSVSRHTTHKSLRSICPPSTMTRPQSGLKICICIA